MTKEQETAFYRSIQFLDGNDLIALKKMVEEQIEYARHLKDNFYLNDQFDNFIYIVFYANGEYHYIFKGKDAYNEYKDNPAAIRLERKTKDLFPKFEILMEKWNEEKGIRSTVSQNEIKASQIQSEQRNRQRHHLIS